jgi:hypothetical protein
MNTDSYISEITNDIVRTEQQLIIAVKLDDATLIDLCHIILAGLYTELLKISDKVFINRFNEVLF